MKKNSVAAFLQAWLFAAATGFWGTATMASAFELTSARLSVLALLCALVALVAAAAFSFRKGGWALPVLTALSIWFFRETLVSSLGSVLYRITSLYHSAYGWPVISIGGIGALGAAPDAALLLFALPGIFLICRGVLKSKRLLPYVAAGFLPLLLCVVVTDTVPDDIYLIGLLACQMLLLLTGLVRRQDPRAATRLTAMLLVPAVLASCLLFWTNPREDFQDRHGALPQWMLDFPVLGSLFSGTGSGESGSIGDPIKLSTLGRKWQTDGQIMTVSSTVSDFLYLRGCAYDHYEDSTWTVTSQQSDKDLLWPVTIDKRGDIIVQTDDILPLIYFPYYAKGQEWSKNMPHGAIENTDRLQKYNFGWYLPMANSVTEALERREKERLEQAYLQLDPALAASLRGFLQEHGFDPADPVESIRQIVESSAEYSLNPGRMPVSADDFAMWFLEDSDAGYCVHFATAATLLLRSMGIPARYVTGYSLSVKAGETTVVDSSHAHAWVEYFESRNGWKILEATPGIGGNEIDPSETLAPTDGTDPLPDTTDPEDTRPQDGTTGAEDRPAPTEQSTSTPEETVSGGQNAPQEISVHPVFFYLLGALALAGLLWLQHTLRRRSRNKKMFSGSPNGQALQRYRHLRLLSRLTRLPLAEELTFLAEKAKYSRHILTQAELEVFSQGLAHYRHALQKRNPFFRALCKLLFAL